MKWTVFLAAVALAGGVAISSAEAQCGYYSRVPARGFYAARPGPYYGVAIGYGPRVYYGDRRLIGRMLTVAASI